ncbi:hypothetical protein BD413DRAFT_569176 [Trametes elegans]|nr:hypothetical protein BD413DRAFT_569176 [Trametes elegans]
MNPPPTDHNVLAVSRKALEDDIAVHAQAIIDLKGRLNTMTTIARLPPELLSEVFMHVVRDSYDTRQQSYHPYYGASRFYAWVEISHVCRSWRSIALNTPRLWGHLILTRKSVVDHVLPRSKKAPLLVCASILSANDERARILEEVMQESSRLKELRLSGPARLVQEFCTKIKEPANLLETMVLSDSSSTPYGYNLGDSSIPVTLFQGQLSRLRHLEIRRLVFSWKLPVFSASITRLVLFGRMDSYSLMGAFDHMLDALDTMPNLQHLELDDAIPRLPDDAKTLSTPQRSVTLSRLQRLVLSGTCLDCANLIHHLSFSQEVRPSIVTKGGNGSQELIRVLQVKAWRAVTDIKTSDPSLELQIDTLASSSVASYLVRDSKIFKHVRILDIDTHYHAWRWKDVCAGMPELRVLTVHGDPQHEFIPALSAVRKTKKNPNSLVLPRLRVLKLFGTRLCSPDYDDPPEFLDDLEDWLLLRCNYDLPIDRLQLTQCLNLTEEDVDRLIEIVPHVDWDGVVQFESEEEDEEEEDDYGMYPYDEDFDYYDDYYDDPWGFF